MRRRACWRMEMRIWISMSKAVWKGGCINGRMHIAMTLMTGNHADQNIAGSLVDTSKR